MRLQEVTKRAVRGRCSRIHLTEARRTTAELIVIGLASLGCTVPQPDPVGGGSAGAPSTGGTSAGATSGGGMAGGSMGGPAGSGVSAGSGGTGGVAPPADCTAPKVGASPLRRLTRREYNNVVRELLGDVTRPADQFVPESAQSGFTNSAESTLLSAVVIDDFERAATALAKEATVPARLAALVGCDPNAAAEQDSCATAFIQDFGARAFRRGLEAEQVADYQALYSSSKASYGFAVAIELVLRSMLQSPHFLYRLEFGEPNPGGATAVALTPEETAARLSFFLWGSLPDTELMQAARDGKLLTPADVRAQASRMLLDDRGRAVLSDFHVQWGQLAGLPNLTKPAPFSPDLGRLLIQETEEFVDQVLRKGDGLLSSLLTSPVGYLNRELADYYGVAGPADSSFVSVTFPPGQRTGLLTQGSFMGNFAHGSESSPVLRGKFFLTQLACSPPQPPPDDVDATLPPPDPMKTSRQQLIELTSEGTCAGCHSLLNPPGFAFEHFDGLGRYRTAERGIAIDASATVTDDLEDLQGSYTNHEDFLAMVATSATVRGCLASKWFIYTHGRIPEDDDACSLAAAAAGFENTGNVRELVLDITETPAFRYYRAQGALQ